MPARAAIVVLLPIFALAAFAAPPEIARFSTTLGDFDVLLRADAAPVSVANFISYADTGRYGSTIIHRSTTYDPGSIQIVQGGGFLLTDSNLWAVQTDPPIALEANLPNLRGTIAMARTSDPNSATSQWFFNVADNAGLDGNYAVFGSIIGSGGLAVLDAMGALTVYNASAQLGNDVFSELPLVQIPPDPNLYLVLVQNVAITRFRITGIQPGTNGVKIDWTALSTNTPVKVERTTNLVTGTWQPVSTNNTGATFTDTNAPASAAFYRVVAE